MGEEVVAMFFASAVNEEGFRVVVRTGEGHRVVVDEPKDMGGGGEGPNPIELLLASLASCFAITSRIHAARMGINVDRVEVEARAELDLRSVLGIEGVEPGLKSIVLKARVFSKARCVDLDNLVSKVLRTWVVGATVAKSGVLRVEVEKIGCT